MSAPAYHLRKNKAADRFALIEAIRCLPNLGGNLREYTYYGFGGPYLEDMRLIYEFCPEIPMVSIEGNPEVYRRQRFHLPCGSPHLIIENCDARSFITQYEPNDKKSIFWLDYNELHYTFFEDFIALLSKVVQGSMIKITLPANPKKYWYNSRHKKTWKVEPFRTEFAAVLPSQTAYPSWESKEFSCLLQEMLRIAAQQALPADASLLKFYPVSSFNYSDGTGMFTLTGVIWPRNNPQAIEDTFSDWEFANLNWGRPRHIEIPDLSTKERLHLQRLLPCATARGAALHAELGYLIDDDIPKTEAALEQYAAFHRYFPYFLRGIP